MAHPMKAKAAAMTAAKLKGYAHGGRPASDLRPWEARLPALPRSEMRSPDMQRPGKLGDVDSNDYEWSPLRDRLDLVFPKSEQEKKDRGYGGGERRGGRIRRK